MERVRETIRALQPVDEGQKWLQNQALEENILLLRQRWLLIEGGGPSVRPAYIGILVFWVVLIFASFGFNAPRNATVVIGFLCCSLAIGSAIFLILELDNPFSGILRIPSGPVGTSLAHMLPAGTKDPERGEAAGMHVAAVGKLRHLGTGPGLDGVETRFPGSRATGTARFCRFYSAPGVSSK